MEIKGKIIAITGANRGIGLAIAEELSKRGAKIIAIMRNKDPKFPIKNAKIITADLSSFESRHNLGNKLSKLNIDILINNAGTLEGGLLENQDMKKVNEMISVNLSATIHLTALVLPLMIKRKSGKIINNTSISGLMNLPAASTYTATKTGVVAFTRSLKQELKGSGVTTLILITPGVETRMYETLRKKYSNHYKVDKIGVVTPEIWAIKVANAIENDKAELYPGGTLSLAAFGYTHFRWLAEIIISKNFKRN